MAFELLKQPETYDLFGLMTFAFITILSIWSLKARKPLPKWAGIILLIIGILGIIVDGFIVYTKFLS